MVPEVSEGYATLVLSGIEERLLQEGYFYFVISHHHRPDLIHKYQHLLLARAVEGIIAVDTPVEQRLSVPMVTVSGHHERDGITNIVLNHKRAAALALEHLRGLGHKQIAFIKGQEFSSDTEARWQAIRHAAAQHDLRVQQKLSRGWRETRQRMSPDTSQRSACWATARPSQPCSHSTTPQRLERYELCERQGCACRRTSLS